MTKETFTFKLVSAADKSELLIDKVIVAGRSEQCELVVKQGQTSRQHSRIGPADNGIWIEDLQSTNGTFINDKPVVGKILATHGDIIKFDTALYVVVDSTIKSPDDTSAEENLIDPDATVLASPTTAKTPLESDKPKHDGALPPSWALEREQAVDGTQLLGSVKTTTTAPNATQFSGTVNVPSLVGKTEPYDNVHFPLRAVSDINQWEIGRADNADIMLNHTSVSNAHAQLVNDGDRWKLVDLMSANGSYINDVKGLTTYLKSGDLIRFGQIECHFVLPNKTETDFGNATTTVAPALSESKASKRNIIIGLIIAVVAVGLIAAFVL